MWNLWGHDLLIVRASCHAPFFMWRSKAATNMKNDKIWKEYSSEGKAAEVPDTIIDEFHGAETVASLANSIMLISWVESS